MKGDWWCAAVVVAALAGALALSPAAGADEQQSNALLTGVNATRLLQVLNQPSPPTTEFGTGVVSYHLRPDKAAGLVDLDIAVTSSEQAASQAYKHWNEDRAHTPPDPQPNPPIGDQFVAEFTHDLFYAAGAQDATEGVMLLRRKNVLVVMIWNGGRDKAYALARQLDEALLHDDQVCSRGDAVPVPEVEFTAPPRVAVGAELEVAYRSTHAILIRTEDNSVLHLEGTIPCEAEKPGAYTVTLEGATGQNVLFTKSITLQAVRPEELSDVVAWNWLGLHMFFVKDPARPWAALPFEEREWMELDRGTFAPLADERHWKLSALAELQGYVQAAWLPTEEVMHAFEDDAHPALDKVYYATFKRKGFGVVYMGTVGKEFSLYVEQPDTPATAGAPELTAQQVLADNLLQPVSEGGETTYPRAEFMVRTLHRYRGFEEKGPFEPVKILLAHVRFASEVNLRFPGYP